MKKGGGILGARVTSMLAENLGVLPFQGKAINKQQSRK